MDAFQHVNNVQYVRYLEDARISMFLNVSAADQVFTLDGDVVVVRHEIDYRRPLVYRPEPVRVETWVTRIGAASFDLAYELADEDAVYVTATSVLASYDAEAGRSRRLTEAQREWLDKHRRES